MLNVYLSSTHVDLKLKQLLTVPLQLSARRLEKYQELVTVDFKILTTGHCLLVNLKLMDTKGLATPISENKNKN